MFKFSFYSLYCDGLDFIRYNKVKLIIIIILSIAACAVGISSSFGIIDVNNYLAVNRYSLVMLAKGTRSVFGYFFMRFLILFLIYALMTLFSYRFILSLLNAVIVFFFAFFMARSIAITLIVLRFSFFPAAIICLIPCTLINVIILSAYTVHTLQISFESQYYKNCGFFLSAFETLCSTKIISIILTLMALIETILAAILTIGITV